jgi:hypothetical protein
VAIVCAGLYTPAIFSSQPALLKLPGAHAVVDLNRPEGLRELIRVAERRIKESEDQEQARHQAQDRLRASRSFAEMPVSDLKEYFSEPRHFVSEKEQRGWKELRRLATVALDASEVDSREECLWQMREIGAAIHNNHRSPSPPHMELLQPPLYYLDYAHNPIAKGEEPARNLESGNGDLSALDPRASTFWTRPGSIAELDLFHGFGRRALPKYDEELWSYAGPKTSYGGCPGFEARSGATKIKVKFAETISEPFAARIFWGLGYNVEATDYARSLKLKYDRRFLREFHLRKDVQMKVRAAIIPVYTVHFQQRYDPFDYISTAVLKSGERISGEGLKTRLFYEPRRKHPEDAPENFRHGFEQELDYLITTPANVQAREEVIKSIGPWDFESFDHADRRELRAAGLLGAWLGWCDSRFENTRLKILQRGGKSELRHFLTDLGGGLGKAKGIFSRHCECPNDFGWRFTRPPKSQGRGKMTVPFRIVDYEPMEDTEAFRRMSYDDARWMARLIGRLTERQIVEALMASGCDATEVRIYTEKLLSRRDWMIRDLGLSGEIALLRAGGVVKNFTYDPRTDALPQIVLNSGRKVEAPSSILTVQNGIVCPELHTRTPLQRVEIESAMSVRAAGHTPQTTRERGN